MKRLSVKGRMTVWYTALMAVMAVMVLVFLLAISSSVATGTAMDQLSQTLRGNLTQVTRVDGLLQFGDGFAFSQNGVTTLIYSENGTLLAGQVPVNLTGVDEPFENGLTRPVDGQGTRYYVLDLRVPIGWEDAIWLRGVMEAPETDQTARNLLLMAAIALPILVVLAALGGYWITRRSFRPLEKIMDAAEAINEAKDLSGRIGLPPGRDEFTRLGETFDQMFERLEHSFEAEKQFTSDVSHELRTPVSVILGACEYAMQFDETEEDRRETIEMIYRQGKRMSEMISQLLSMTRLEQGTEAVRRERVDLAGLVRALCAERHDRPGALILDLEEGVAVTGDETLLTRLVSNLVENAFKYGRPDGHVWVTLRGTEQEALLAVRDDGIGIPEAEQEKIWKRFYQVDPSRAEGGGTGLGLAMVQQIAQLHGGRVEVTSTPALGSTFTLHLPLEKKV